MARQKSATAPTGHRGPVSRCVYDGTQLDASGFCLSGNGYPDTRPCPFACPLCRGDLTWSGACFRCHGTETPQVVTSWTFPGARFERDHDDGTPIGDGHHWVKIAEPNRRVPLSGAQTSACAAIVGRAVRGEMTTVEAHRAIDGIFEEAFQR